MSEWYKIDTKGLCSSLETDQDRGLSSEQARERTQNDGESSLFPRMNPPFFKLFLKAFSSPSSLLLIIAAIIAFFLGEYINAVALILAITGINFLIFREWKKRSLSFQEFKFYGKRTATVIRDGKKQVIPSNDLVSGDLVLLESGDFIGADMRFIECNSLRIEESIIRGESISVKKNSGVIEKNTPLLQQSNMAFAGTTVLHGSGKGIVVATGQDTCFAGVFQNQDEYVKDFLELPAIPDTFNWKTKLILIGLVLIIGTIFRYQDFGFVLLGLVSLAVAAVPEGAIALSTINSRTVIQKLNKKGISIRTSKALHKLPKVDTLCINLGDLILEDELNPQRIFTNNKLVKVTDKGFATYDRELDTSTQDAVGLLMKIGLMCNNAKPKSNESGDLTGSPVDKALIRLGNSIGMVAKEIRKSFYFVDEIPFDSQRKLMSCVYKTAKQECLLLTKGAPENILDKCRFLYLNHAPHPLGDDSKAMLLNEFEKLASAGLKVIGFSYKPLGKDYASHYQEEDMIFVGLIAFKMAVKTGVRDQFESLNTMGIDTMIISGENEHTLKYIMKEVGFIVEDNQIKNALDIKSLNDTDLLNSIKGIKAVSRVKADSKTRILSALRKAGRKTALLGLEPFDTPALMLSQLPFTFSSTDNFLVAKSSQIIFDRKDPGLVKECFKEGRNFQKSNYYGTYLFSTISLAEIFSILFCFIFKISAFLLPIQILWVNFVNGSLIARAASRYDEFPRQIPTREENLKIFEIIIALVISLGVAAIFLIQDKFLACKYLQVTAGGFLVISLIQAKVFISLKRKTDYFVIGFIVASLFLFVLIPPLGRVFYLSPINAKSIFNVLLCSFIPILLLEIYNFISRRR
ncbi:cation-transporting P-type ATPase [bacterium]|nr:cation-transporting P-type ATPase [bacterium]